MNLIKQLAADIAETQEQFETQFPEAEKVARKLGLMSEADVAKPNPSEDCNRIASYWRGRAHKMTDAELRSAIGTDLEQLDYSPEDVTKLVPRVMSKVKK